MFKLSVQYKGGAGFVTTRKSLADILNRLDNISLGDEAGQLVVQSITITREK